MTLKERIHAEVERVDDANLDELYLLIQRFVASKGPGAKPGILSKLRNVKIDAPADFATNLDLYLSGEKRGAENLH